MTVYLVRHAHAGNRHDWEGDDRERPLSRKGQKQAEAIDQRLRDRPITRVLSSPFVRCRETVEPLAARHDVPVESSSAMAEGAPTADAVDLIRSLSASGSDAVLCSHGDVIPDVIRALSAGGVTINGRRSAAKGGTFVIDAEDGKPVRVTYVDP